MQPQFNFLNIEFIFNRVYDVFLWIKYIYLFKINSGSEAEYSSLYCNKNVYDGLCERFAIGSGGPLSENAQIVDSSLNTFFEKLLSIFGGDSNSALVSSTAQLTADPISGSWLINILGYIRDITSIIFLILIGIYIYSRMGWRDASKRYEKKFEDAYIPKVEKAKNNTRWNIIQAHLESGNQAEWRLAILEADNMLADLLETLPYAGVSVGEKLTNANKDNFKSLNDAWESHKIRNKKAHDGAAFVLTEREAERVINLYYNVFSEFRYGLE